MKHFYIIVNLSREHVQEAQVSIKAYLEAKGAECLLHHTPERTRGAAHISGAQVSGDTECVIIIGGGGTLIQAARDLVSRNIPMLGVNRGRLGYLSQVSCQEDTTPALESLLDECYQLERRVMIHGTVWRREEILLRDIALSEIAIIRKDLLKVSRYSVYVNDEYLNEYAADNVLVATPTGSTAYNLSAEGPIITPGARMMVLTPICSHSLNVRSIVLAPEDRIRIKVFNNGQVVSFDGDTPMELRVGDCIDIRCSGLQTVMMKVKRISFMQDLSNHLGGTQTSGSAEHYKPTRREASHMKVEHHSKIVELIGKYEAETQEELAEGLNEAGFNVTQATVSGDIRELKLTKVQSESDRQRYMVLESPRGISAIKYIRTLRDGHISMDMAQNILVIKTVPSMAMAAAVALGATQFHEIASCIAGDDTIMCAIRSVDNTIIVMEKIKEMAEG